MNDLADTINKINWNEIRYDFTSNIDLFEKAEEKFKLLAHWAKGVEKIYFDNRALPFMREAQISSQDFFCACALGLYKCSVSSIRTIFESVLYFSYFKDHPKELNSVLKRNLYLSRAELIQFHEEHTEGFSHLYTKTNLKEDLEKMYKETSSIVHAQKPGTWHSTSNLSERGFNNNLCEKSVHLYCSTIDVISLLLLCTLDNEEWLTINPKSRNIILSHTRKNNLSLINKKFL